MLYGLARVRLYVVRVAHNLALQFNKLVVCCRNKTENQSETCALLKLEAFEIKIEARFGLSGPENPEVPILEAVGAI